MITQDQKPMETRCFRCAKTIQSDQKGQNEAYEVAFGRWTSELIPYSSVRILCRDCTIKVNVFIGELDEENRKELDRFFKKFI